MKISSNFKDYYDSVAQTGIDTSVVYQRQVQRVQLENPPFADVPVYFPDENDTRPYDDFLLRLRGNNLRHTQFKIIGFCGKLYVGLFSPKHDANNFDETHDTALFGEEILALKWQKKATHRHLPPRVMLENCLADFHKKENNDFFKALNCPIFAIDLRHNLTQYETKNKGLYLPHFVCNSPLNIFQFYKIIDPYSAFQQIQSYISGVLGAGPQPIDEAPNSNKIQKAGFDLKTSFRKPKQQ